MALKPIPLEIIKHYNPAFNSEKELLETMYKNKTMPEIADILGYSYSFISRRLHSNNIKIKGRSGNWNNPKHIFSKIPKEQIEQMTQHELAEKCECTRQNIGRLLKEFGYKYKSNRLKKGEKHARTKTSKK